MISAIIPTYNEEHKIGSLLKNLKELGAEEVIVADGNSVDRTVEIASAYARVIRSQTCRALQMNAGGRAASGEVLLFLHADVRLGAGGLAAVKDSLRDPEAVGGNFDIRYEGSDWVAAAFTSVNRWRRRLGVFYGDSGIFCRRKVFEALGGYAPWPILDGLRLRTAAAQSGQASVTGRTDLGFGSALADLRPASDTVELVLGAGTLLGRCGTGTFGWLIPPCPPNEPHFSLTFCLRGWAG
jgi:glycosyltransferase involved in cell wall biosynthesis